jgi:hypothetical protein
MLAPGDDANRFDQRKAGRIIGYVVKVQASGRGESCNCGATDPIDMDTHIEIIPDPALGNNSPQRVVVEITPRLRSIMAGQNKDWSSEALRAAMYHRWVEFEGWLFWDPDHVTGAINTDPPPDQGEPNWRATAWELHPVTSYRVLNGPPNFWNLGNIFSPRAVRAPAGASAVRPPAAPAPRRRER